MKKNIILTVSLTVLTILCGCGSAPNDDPKASIAGTSKFRHEMPGGAPAPAGSNSATPVAPPQAGN